MLTVYAIGRPKVLVRTKFGNSRHFYFLIFEHLHLFFLIIAPYLHRHNIIFLFLIFFGLVFLYLLFLVFCPLTLRRVHACQQVLATAFTSHSLLSFHKVCIHSTASTFGGCAGIKAGFFVKSNFYIIAT